MRDGEKLVELYDVDSIVGESMYYRDTKNLHEKLETLHSTGSFSSLDLLFEHQLLFCFKKTLSEASDGSMVDCMKKSISVETTPAYEPLEDNGEIALQTVLGRVALIDEEENRVVLDKPLYFIGLIDPARKAISAANCSVVLYETASHEIELGNIRIGAGGSFLNARVSSLRNAYKQPAFDEFEKAHSLLMSSRS